MSHTAIKMRLVHLISVLLSLPCSIFSLEKIDLVTFDGSDGTTFKFSELNDPVMVRNRFSCTNQLYFIVFPGSKSVNLYE